jgi:hypothetical protein
MLMKAGYFDFQRDISGVKKMQPIKTSKLPD